ncbi:hypothetical protein EGK76_10235 [Luteimonas sp. 100069]|nr:hypothetical protein EGK76_10235 [Luteimonas sp. 100069]
MAMKSLIAHVLFAFVLFLFSAGVAAVFVSTGMKIPWVGQAAELALVIPAALLLAARLGRLSVPGVALAATAVVLACQGVTILAFDYLARPVGGSVGWAELYGDGRAPALAGGAAITVLGSVAWLLILRRMGSDGVLADASASPPPAAS